VREQDPQLLSSASASETISRGQTVLSADGTTLWYSDAGGPGEVILFIHGFSGSSSAAGHFAARAGTAGYRFVTPDLRGHGLSQKPMDRGAYDMPRFIEDFEAVIDRCGALRVHAVGHCLGGMVATACAAAFPDRIATLTLIGTSLRPAADQQLAAWAEQRSPGWVRSLARRAFPSGTDAPAHVDYTVFDDTGDFYWRRMVADYRALSADTAFAILEHLENLDLGATAGSVAAAALVVHGGRDSVFPTSCAQDAAAAINGARLLILPEDNHVSLVLRPDSRLFGAVLEFLAEVGEPAPALSS
jgi:pimeloyl-ACP methyl ester carboxylesterase